MGILDKVKQSIFEDEPEKAKAAVLEKLKPEIKMSTPIAPRIISAPGNPDYHSGAYQALKEKTNFETSQSGQILMKYLKPLQIMPFDEHTKLKAAVAQAAAQEDLSTEKILATFDGLKVTLKNENDGFNDICSKQLANQVANRKKELDDLTSQMTSMAQRVLTLQSEITAEQAKVDHAQMEFSAAYQARLAELDQEKERYANLLKG